MAEIKKINNIRGIGKFEQFSQEIDFTYGDTNTNIVFGFNGSGKTTISNAMSLYGNQTFISEEQKKALYDDLKKDDNSYIEILLSDKNTIKYPAKQSHNKEIFVFNTHFVAEHIFDGTRGKAKRFSKHTAQLINKEIKDIQDCIANLEKELLDLEKTKNHLNDLYESSKDTYKKEFNKLIQGKRLTYPDLLKTHLPKKPTNEIEENLKRLKDDYLLSQKQSEFKEDISKLKEIDIDRPHIDFDNIQNILSTNIAHLSKVALEQKIATVKNLFEEDNYKNNVSTWYKFGKDILCKIQKNDKEKKLCPLCNTDLTLTLDKLLSDYEAYFDTSYEEFSNNINRVIRSLKDSLSNIAKQKDLIKTFKNIRKKYYTLLQEHNFDNVIKVNVENAIQGIIDALEEKSQDIKSAKKINPEAINQITNYCEEIKIVKQKIESDIKILESKKLDENEIVDNIKNNYIDLIILQFNNEEKGNLAKYKNTLQKIEEINGDSEKGIKFLNQRLSQEIKKIKIESKTIEKYLLKLGLDHFTIDISDSDFENITISYNNTEKNKIRNSLSEGEKTALAFSYFLSKYENEVNSIEEQKKSVVIIDDPISSLDENRLYSTAILIKDFFKNTRQLIVMSHNFLFLKFFNANVKNPNTLFLDDNSLVSLPEELQNFETPYYYMLKKIIDFAENENADYNQVKLYLPNFIRRVLETFLSFKFSRISQKNKKDSSRSPGLKEYREDIDLTTYDDKTKELLKYNLDIIIKITDTHSHGNAHNQQDGFYISEKDLKILANSSLQIIDEMDKLHFSSYKQKEIN